MAFINYNETLKIFYAQVRANTGFYTQISANTEVWTMFLVQNRRTSKSDDWVGHMVQSPPSF